MARRRRTSQVLDAARQRLAGLKSITPEPDLGDTLTVEAYTTRITTFDTHLDTYNQHLAALDDELNSINAEEAELRDWNKRMLSGIEAHFGGDSSQYEAVGGKRISERKKSRRSGGTPPPTTP